MKKVLVVLLAVAMLFCFTATAMAYTDSADMDATTANAVNKVSGLGVMGGYPDGSFQANGTITRAEFAKMAVAAAGLADAAALMEDQTSSYTDVKAGAWYTGWINLASAKGYLKGYPDGSFKPNAPITQQEVITVYLRLLGYDESKLVGP